MERREISPNFAFWTRDKKSARNLGVSGKLIQKASWTFEQSSRNPDPFPFGFSRRTRAISCLKVSDKPFKAHSSRSIAGRPKHGESQEIQENLAGATPIDSRNPA